MRLAMQTEFELRTSLYLAARRERATVAEVAHFYKISIHHLGKVAYRLGKLDLVRNLRRPGGGIELARPSSGITVGAVVAVFEVRTSLLECVDMPGMRVIQPGCRLCGVLAEAERSQLDYLNRVTLESLVLANGDLVSLTVPLP
jgi:Rrf2 family nitric oxide-sensitive transcriptional repressor